MYESPLVFSLVKLCLTRSELKYPLVDILKSLPF